MITLFLLILGGIGIVLAAERHPATRNAMQKLAHTYSPGTCRSFILDIPILLPLVGLLVEAVAKRIKSRRVAAWFPTIIGSGFVLSAGFTQNPLIGLIGFLFYVFFAPVAILGEKTFVLWSARQTLYITAIGIFLAISGSLYFDYLNLFILSPFLGHAEAWNGNHFMWNSGIEVLGLRPFINTIIPTYRNFLGSWNLLAMSLFFIIYPLVMVKMGTWLHGLLFGYTEKQTGISALFFERKTH